MHFASSGGPHGNPKRVSRPRSNLGIQGLVLRPQPLRREIRAYSRSEVFGFILPELRILVSGIRYMTPTFGGFIGPPVSCRGAGEALHPGVPPLYLQPLIGFRV